MSGRSGRQAASLSDRRRLARLEEAANAAIGVAPLLGERLVEDVAEERDLARKAERARDVAGRR